MAGAITTACQCGGVQLRVSVPKTSSATRVTCYCKDCQTGANLASDPCYVMTSGNGTDIVQTTPDRLEIMRGAELLEVIRLGPKGLFRWYAGCCNTPMFNTLSKPARPFVGVVLHDPERDLADKVIGAPTAYVSTGSATGGPDVPEKDIGFLRAGLAIVGRMIAACVSGRCFRNPLVDTSRQPIAPVRVLTLQERNAARPK